MIQVKVAYILYRQTKPPVVGKHAFSRGFTHGVSRYVWCPVGGTFACQQCTDGGCVKKKKNDKKEYFFQSGQFAALISFTFKSTQENAIFVGKG